MQLRTKEEWEELYKRTSANFRDGGKDFYRQAESEAIWISKWYMSGEISIEEVKHWLWATGCTWPFERSKSLDLLRKGVKYAIDEGIAIESRTQPEQPDEERVYASIKLSKKIDEAKKRFMKKARVTRT